jgi:hypothetical protein
MDNKAISHECMFDNATSKFDDKVRASNFVMKLKKLFLHFVPQILTYINKELNPIVLTSDCNLIYSLIKLVNAVLVE